MSQTFRVGDGLVDCDTRFSFTFNRKTLVGHPGDTLASALLANGQCLVGRSFKYHRPRGIFACGPEDPNALVTLGDGAFTEPNTVATTVELADGLIVRSQNHRGSLRHDLLAVNDLLPRFLAAGFYYKTFMWPKSFWEKVYEPVIRSAAGLGKLSGLEDPDHYDKGFLHCDLLIIGSGPAGLAAAVTAAGTGASVILAEQDFVLGGRMNAESQTIDGRKGSEVAQETTDGLRQTENLRIMTRTTVYGAFDHGVYGAIERRTDYLPGSDCKPRQILWRIYARRSLLCAGATERPIAFPDNDRPGIMLAGAARAYLNRFGVAAGTRVAVFTNNDDGWRTAVDYRAQGLEVVAVIDTRSDPAVSELPNTAAFPGSAVTATRGRRRLAGIRVAGAGWLKVDCLAVSGGWNPNVHLSCHLRGRPRWEEKIAAFVPGGELPAGMRVAGAANGRLTTVDAIREGSEAAADALSELGYDATFEHPPEVSDESHAVSAYWHVPDVRGRCWVDFQNDVTTKDIDVAVQEGFKPVEMLKRYTTAGMATDQGKTGNVNTLAILAERTGKSIAETGTTIYRPPFVPVSIGALGGRSRGKAFRPSRLTPSHQWSTDRGAVFVEVGLWKRPQWYPVDGENHWRESVNREVVATRKSVGICDVSTLGKIELVGRDVGAFLDKVYANRFSTLKRGKVRYGLMLREDGIAYDDGTTARFGEERYVMSTTTANAGLVFRNLEFAHQCLWPRLDISMMSVTDNWAQFSVAGPRSRQLLQKFFGSSFELSNEAFGFMSCAEIELANGTPCRLFRISFSGELAYEVAVPAAMGNSMMAHLMSIGEEFDAVPYGTEALGVMRIEKGHFAGNELDGRTTAHNLGLGRMVAGQKDNIGAVLSQREAFTGEDGVRLVGLVPVDKAGSINAGTHLLPVGKSPVMENDEGWVSSAAYSPTLGHAIGLGFLKRGHARHGEIVRAYDRLRGADFDVSVVSPHFYDPEGKLQRG